MDGRLTITDIAKTLGVTPRTIMRWEKAGKIKKSRRDWRGWRFYLKEDLMEIKNFYESSYEYDELDRSIAKTTPGNILSVIIALTVLFSSFILSAPALSEANANNAGGIKETAKSVDIVLEELPVVETAPATLAEELKYTLGPNDVMQIDVRRHPEFSGQYTVNSEGKIEYKHVGDIIVNGLTKAEVKKRLTKILSEYLINAEIDVQIVAYLSKLFYVVGDVHRPGKFFMRGDTITVREALMQAGLPTQAAAMRRCRLITPDNRGKNNYTNVNVYSLLYEGNLKQNLVMKPNDVLYIPATVMAKVIRVIAPVTGAISQSTEVVRDSAGVAAAAL